MDTKITFAPVKHLPAEKHGSLEKVFENIWVVQGAAKMPMWMPMRISRTMTVVRNPENGDLTLINSMRLSEAGLSELDRLGKVAHVIRVGGFHGRDDGYYRDRYGARIYAIEGQVYSRKLGDNPNPKIYMEPDVWLSEENDMPIDGASLKILKSSSPPEAILRLPNEGGILVTGDSLQNTPEPDEFVNFPAKQMMRKMGFYKPCLVGPAWLQFAKPSKSEVRAIIDLDFEHVLPGHGLPVIGQAKEKYRSSIEGKLAGCHE